MDTSAIRRAVEIAGSQTKLARKIGVRQSDVWAWLQGRPVKADKVLAIEAATGVSRHEFRHDIFGAAAPAVASSQQSPKIQHVAYRFGKNV